MWLKCIDPKVLESGDVVMIRLGDDTLLTDATISSVDTLGNRIYFVDNEDPHLEVKDYIDDVDVWLVHRPKKLPTKLGSVVKVEGKIFVLAGSGFRPWWERDSCIWRSSEDIESITKNWELVE